MSIELRDQLRQKYGASLSTPVHSAKIERKLDVERAFVLTGDKGRTIITAPLREVAAINQGFTYLRGRYVEADSPNLNGAMWTTEDLQMGAPTVAGGPLNWLHQDHKIIGALVDGSLQPGREAADDEPAIGNHIVSDAVLWSFLFPNETHAIGKAAADGTAFFSMECLSRAVACVDTPDRPGCGEEFSYADYDANKACEHLNGKTGVRRFVDPYFLGAGVIVPPVKPGWANAHLSLTGSNAMSVEAANLQESLSERQAAAMVNTLMEWANR